MPTWCYNDVTISHSDPTVIDRIIKAYERGALFDEFIPCATELLNDPPNDEEAQRRTKMYGADKWYDWRRKYWGTKWDIGAEEDGREDITVISPNEIELRADTAWTPPVPILDHWVDLGCHIVGTFDEPGEYHADYEDKRVVEADVSKPDFVFPKNHRWYGYDTKEEHRGAELLEEAVVWQWSETQPVVLREIFDDELSLVGWAYPRTGWAGAIKVDAMTKDSRRRPSIVSEQLRLSMHRLTNMSTEGGYPVNNTAPTLRMVLTAMALITDEGVAE